VPIWVLCKILSISQEAVKHSKTPVYIFWYINC